MRLRDPSELETAFLEHMIFWIREKNWRSICTEKWWRISR